MDKAELYELIAAYLGDELPTAQRQEVEQRMAADDAFREEVELHRALQEDYRDPSRWRLREALTEIMNEPAPPEEPLPATPPNAANRRWKWWVAIPVVLILGVGIWYFNRPTPSPPTQQTPPAETTPAPPPVENQPQTPPTEDQPETRPPVPDAPTQKTKKTRLIAQADPADFTENPSLEGLMGMRGGAILEMTSPKPIKQPSRATTTFVPDAAGKTELRFSGTMEKMPAGSTVLLDLLVVNNKDSTLLAIPLQLTADADGKAAFDLREQVGFKMGLYYFRIEERETGEVLVAGRFEIKS